MTLGYVYSYYFKKVLLKLYFVLIDPKESGVLLNDSADDGYFPYEHRGMFNVEFTRAEQ